MRTIYTGGTFDILHSGHVNFFRNIRYLFGQNCELVVSLNKDDFILKYKGHPPIFNYKERFDQITMTGLVDRIIPNFGGADSKPAILRVMPNVIAIGTDWLKKDYCKQMGFTPEWLEKIDVSLVYIPYTKGISTSEIIRRLDAR